MSDVVGLEVYRLFKTDCEETLSFYFSAVYHYRYYNSLDTAGSFPLSVSALNSQLEFSWIKLVRSVLGIRFPTIFYKGCKLTFSWIL